MKRLFDAVCDNPDCDAFGESIELWKKFEDEYPDCEVCGKILKKTITKTPSVWLVGGKGAGYTNDGFINTGATKNVRRKNP